MKSTAIEMNKELNTIKPEEGAENRRIGESKAHSEVFAKQKTRLPYACFLLKEE